jgi:hypothetical protein
VYSRTAQHCRTAAPEPDVCGGAGLEGVCVTSYHPLTILHLPRSCGGLFCSRAHMMPLHAFCTCRSMSRCVSGTAVMLLMQTAVLGHCAVASATVRLPGHFHHTCLLLEGARAVVCECWPHLLVGLGLWVVWGLVVLTQLLHGLCRKRASFVHMFLQWLHVTARFVSCVGSKP